MKKLILTLLLALSLGACGATDNQTPIDNSITLTDVYYELSVDEFINYETVLPQTIEGVDILWQSSESGIIRNNQITDYQYNADTSLTASFSIDGKTMTKTFSVSYISQSGLTHSEVQFETIKSNFIYVYDNTYVDDNFILPTTVDNASLIWYYAGSIVTNTDMFDRPTSSEGDQDITVSYTISFEDLNYTGELTFTLKAVEDTNTGNTYTGYYEGLDGLTGTALRNFLHDLIDDHHILTYDEVKYAIRDTDEDPNNSNNVILFYTGRSQPKSTFGGGADDYNREHVWAKSHGDFGNAMGPGTDLHHLRPTDASVNSTRGNLDFDEGGSEVYDQGVATGNYRDSDSWEPRDEVKGDVARIVFYMAIRYEGDDGYPDLELNNRVNNGSNPYIGNLETLLRWHLEDPVDEFEMNRNNVIFDYQGNRNPFIDHPELAELIWGTTN